MTGRSLELPLGERAVITLCVPPGSLKSGASDAILQASTDTWCAEDLRVPQILFSK